MDSSTNALVSVLVGKHLPGMHDQQHHAGTTGGDVTPVPDRRKEQLIAEAQGNKRPRKVVTRSQNDLRGFIAGLNEALPGPKDIRYSNGDKLSSVQSVMAINGVHNGNAAYYGTAGAGKSILLQAIARSLLPRKVGPNGEVIEPTMKDITDCILQCTDDTTTAAVGGTVPVRRIMKEDDIVKLPVQPARWLRHEVKIIEEPTRLDPKKQAVLFSILQNTNGQGARYVSLENGAQGEFPAGVTYLAFNKDAPDHMNGGDDLNKLSPALKDRITAMVGHTINFADSKDMADNLAMGRSPVDAMAGIHLTPDQRAKMRDEINNMPMSDRLHSILTFAMQHFSVAPGVSDNPLRNTRSIAQASVGIEAFNQHMSDTAKKHNIEATDQPGFLLSSDPSKRVMQDVVTYAKSLAYVRGAKEVNEEDLRFAWAVCADHRLELNRTSSYWDKVEGKPGSLDSHQATYAVIDGIFKLYNRLGGEGRKTSLPNELNPFKMDARTIRTTTVDELAGMLASVKDRIRTNFSDEVAVDKPNLTRDADLIQHHNAVDQLEALIESKTTQVID